LCYLCRSICVGRRWFIWMTYLVRFLSSFLPQEKDFSLSLTSAFAFADSLTHGACGHDPIKLDLTSWNTLVKACCYRGAIWRAMEILNDTLPRQGIEPDAFTYNTIIAGLARLVRKCFVCMMLL
jgi:hypothetical protein